jgi:hypothetical protein
MCGPAPTSRKEREKWGNRRGWLLSLSGRALTVGEVGALSDFDDIAVRIADVAAYLAVLGYGGRDEFGSSTFP